MYCFIVGTGLSGEHFKNNYVVTTLERFSALDCRHGQVVMSATTPQSCIVHNSVGVTRGIGKASLLSLKTNHIPTGRITLPLWKVLQSVLCHKLEQKSDFQNSCHQERVICHDPSTLALTLNGLYFVTRY